MGSSWAAAAGMCQEGAHLAQLERQWEEWGRTDGDMSPPPVHGLYLGSPCWRLLLSPCVTLVLVFLGEEFPILLHLSGQPVPIFVKSPGNM